jgi:hypothetical protein
MRRHQTAPVPALPGMSVAISGTDFTALETAFAAFIPAAGFAQSITLSRGSRRNSAST